MECSVNGSTFDATNNQGLGDDVHLDPSYVEYDGSWVPRTIDSPINYSWHIYDDD